MKKKWLEHIEWMQDKCKQVGDEAKQLQQQQQQQRAMYR